jgi:O-antigen ligase/tetratricopeptide (TPR) repeat protein
MTILRLGAWVVLVLSAIFFLTTGGTYPGIASVDAHVIGQVIAMVVFGGWLALALVRPSWRIRTPLLLPIAVATAVYVASALVSQRPRLSLEPTMAGVGWALAFLFLTRLLASPWFRARAAVVMTAFVSVVAFGYVAQVLIEWWNWWGLIGKFAIPPLRPSFAALFLGSPNLIATALMLLAPLVVARLWTRTRGQGLALVIGVTAALAFFLAGSRGAYLGAALGALVAVALALQGGRGAIAGAIARVRSTRVLWVPLGLIVLGGLVLAPSVLLRIAQGGGTLRVDLWRSAISIFSEHPVLGSGPGTWVQLKVAANPPGVPNLILPHAHDLYVQAAAELGVVGLAALAVLEFAVIQRVWQAWRNAPALSLEAAAVLVSLAAFAGQSVVDNVVNLPFVCLLLATIVAWIDGGLPTEAGHPQGRHLDHLTFRGYRLKSGPLLPVIGLAALVVMIPTIIRIDGAAYRNAAGDSAAVAGRWQAAFDAYDAAHIEDPGFTLYEIQTASALSRLGKPAEARGPLADAIRQDPVALNVLGLAALDQELGDPAAARAHIEAAIALGPAEPAVALNAGLLAERLGDPDLALEQFAIAIAIDPPLIRSGLWVSPPRLVTKAAIVERARSLLEPIDAALVLAYAGDPIAARGELEQLPQSAPRDVYIAATLWLAGESAAAIARLQRILTADPNDWFAAAWAARISLQDGDAAASSRYTQWAMAVQGDAAPSVINEISSVPPGPREVSVNLPGTYPWAVYLRPVSPYLTMHELVLIGGGG